MTTSLDTPGRASARRIAERRSGREWFLRAADGYLAALEQVQRAPLDTIALGAWSLRDLLGHASRAFLTIETYLEAERDASAPQLADSTAYYREVLGRAAADSSASSNAIARRGRAAGRALGDDPVAATREIAARVVALVESTPDDAVVSLPWGWMRLGDYLATRAFELTVHGMDVARATGLEIPEALAESAADAIAVTFDMATPEELTAALLALAGRESLPARFSIVP